MLDTSNMWGTPVSALLATVLLHIHKDQQIQFDGCFGISQDFPGLLNYLEEGSL